MPSVKSNNQELKRNEERGLGCAKVKVQSHNCQNRDTTSSQQSLKAPIKYYIIKELDIYPYTVQGGSHI